MTQEWDKWKLIDEFTNRANKAHRNLENEDYKSRPRRNFKDFFRLEATLYSTISDGLMSCDSQKYYIDYLLALKPILADGIENRVNYLKNWNSTVKNLIEKAKETL